MGEIADPVFALIAEMERCDLRAMEAEGGPDHPLSAAARAAYRRLVATKPATLAGAVAMLESELPFLDDCDLFETVIEGLLDIARREGIA